MKLRLAMCAVAALLALGAVSSEPASACAYTCNVFECNDTCVQRGYAGGTCTVNLCYDRCVCYH